MNNKFKFFIPAEIVKSETTSTTGVPEWKVKGIASTTSRDSQDEFLDPSGMDLSRFQWINWNHLGKDDPRAIIGEPTLAQVTPQNELYIEALLYPHMEFAKGAWDLMNALVKSPSGNRLSLSVEGKVIERDPLDKRRIKKSAITAVAICPTPINGDTWVDLITKGETNMDIQFEKAEQDCPECHKPLNKDGKCECGYVAKAMDTENTHILSPESIDGVKNKPLNKSEIYERIFNQYPSVEIETAKQIYLLTNNIAQMSKKEISAEDLNKAFSILELAKAEGKPSKKSKKDPENKDDDDNNDDENKDEDEDAKEMVEKAVSVVSIMKSENKSEDDIKKSLLKKGFNETIITKAMEFKPAPVSSSNPLILKSIGALGDILKAQTMNIDSKFAAVGELFAETQETITSLKDDLTKSLDANKILEDRLKKVEDTPNPAKSVVKSSYVDRFAKSENGENDKPVFNLQKSADVTELSNRVEAHADQLLAKSDENGFNQYMKIAQDLQLSKTIQRHNLPAVAALGLVVVDVKE